MLKLINDVAGVSFDEEIEYLEKFIKHANSSGSSGDGILIYISIAHRLMSLFEDLSLKTVNMKKDVFTEFHLNVSMEFLGFVGLMAFDDGDIYYFEDRVLTRKIELKQVSF